MTNVGFDKALFNKDIFFFQVLHSTSNKSTTQEREGKWVCTFMEVGLRGFD